MLLTRTDFHVEMLDPKGKLPVLIYPKVVLNHYSNKNKISGTNEKHYFFEFRT